MRAKEAGKPLPVFQLLVYPVTDSDFTRASYIENADGYLLTEVAMRWFWALCQNQLSCMSTVE